MTLTDVLNRLPWIRWVPPVVVLICGLYGSVSVSESVRREAVESWETNAEQVAQWLSGAFLGWLEESYATISGVTALYENSNEVSPDEFFNAYDSLEARATAFFLDVIAVAVPVGEQSDPEDWEFIESSDPFSLLEPGQRASAIGELAQTALVGWERFGRAVLGPPIIDAEGKVYSAVTIVTETPNGPVAVFGLLNYHALFDGLQLVHSPRGHT